MKSKVREKRFKKLRLKVCNFIGKAEKTVDIFIESIIFKLFRNYLAKCFSLMEN